MSIVSFSLEGKTALVTGGSKGIGRAIALAFAEHGADVAIAARGAEALEATCQEIQATGRRSVCVPTDVSSDEELEKLHQVVCAELGDVDILVNNVGGAEPVGLAQLTYEQFEKKGFPQNMLRTCGEPEHIAGMAVLLASPAGAYCHGEIFVVDGGEMWRPTYTDEEADTVISELDEPA